MCRNQTYIVPSYYIFIDRTVIAYIKGLYIYKGYDEIYEKKTVYIINDYRKITNQVIGTSKGIYVY